MNVRRVVMSSSLLRLCLMQVLFIPVYNDRHCGMLFCFRVLGRPFRKCHARFDRKTVKSRLKLAKLKKRREKSVRYKNTLEFELWKQQWSGSSLHSLTHVKRQLTLSDIIAKALGFVTTHEPPCKCVYRSNSDDIRHRSDHRDVGNWTENL